MEVQVWRQLYLALTEAGKTHSRKRKQFSDSWIALTFCWSVLHDRPRCWACQSDNWNPRCLDDRVLPSRRTLGRRLNSIEVQLLLQQAQDVLRQQFPSSYLKWIDAKPLPVGGCSKDRDAHCGRAANGKARGYKIHGLWDAAGRVIDDWRLAPMSVNEKRVARELLPAMVRAWYVASDNQYDGNEMYELTAQQGAQLLTNPRQPRPEGRGHRRQSVHRLRSLALSDNPLQFSGQARSFGQDLLHSRIEVERRYGLMGNFGGGLGPLPNWVRTPRRVALWVQMKILIFTARQAIKQRLAA